MTHEERSGWTLFIRIVGAIIAVLSLGLNIVQYSENKAKEYTINKLGKDLLETTSKWLGSERREREHLEKIEDLTQDIQTSEKRKQEYRQQSELYREQANKFKTLAEYYEGKYNDYDAILDLTDSEHFEFFLEWTTPGL